MSPFWFPVVGSVLVFFGVVPVLSLVARSMLWLCPQGADPVTHQGSPWRLLLVVAPTLAPLTWLISASIHQSESGAPLAACLVDRLGQAQFNDVIFFGLILFSPLGLGVVRHLRRERNRALSRPSAPLQQAASQRLQAVYQHTPRLARYRQRIHLVQHGIAPVCTRFLFRPQIEIEANLVLQLDEEELKATLLHEVEHACAKDPLRLLVAQVALSLNPLGCLLTSELNRYHFAREALCDKRAVQCGADPLALARSIVSVASPRAMPSTIVALGGHGLGGIRLRVHLLLGYAACRPAPAQRRPLAGLISILITLLALSPHLTGAAPLAVFHVGIERAALVLGLG